MAKTAKSPEPIPQPEKRKMGLWAFIILIILIGAAYLFLILPPQTQVKNLRDQVTDLQRQIVDLQNENQSLLTKAAEKKPIDNNSLIYYAVKNELSAVVENATSTEYIIKSYNPGTMETVDAAVIINNIYQNPFSYASNQIYFLSPSGEINAFSLTYQKQALVEIPGIKPSTKSLTKDTIWDFIISDGKIFYLKGICQADSDNCSLNSYDLITHDSVNIIKKITSSDSGLINVLKYDKIKNEITLREVSGDVTNPKIEIFIASLDDKKLATLETTTLNNCESSDNGCTLEQKNENAKYQELIAVSYDCQNLKIVQNPDLTIKITTPTAEKSLTGSYVGCEIK